MANVQSQDEQGSISQINITPLVDVLLVLLVIFMIAAPVFSKAIPLNLTRGEGDAPQAKPIELRIDATGEVYFDNQLVPRSALPAMFSAEAQRDSTDIPSLHIDASQDVQYEVVAKILAEANNAGLRKIRFRQ